MSTPLYGEFLGTLLLILLGNGSVANVVLSKTKGHASGWIVVTFGWGMAVFVAVWCVGSLSGAHLNPAVTLGLAVAGKFAWPQVWGYVAAQLAGAFCGAMLVWLHYRDHYALTEQPDLIRATFATAPAVRHPMDNLLCEVIGTFVLVLAVLLAVEPSILPIQGGMGTNQLPELKVGLGSLGALPVGLLVLAIGLSLGGTTGYAINPARDLGPRLAHALLPISGKGDSDWAYAWVPIVGPLLGGLLAAVLAR